jgi:hypothetical protein
MTPKKKENKKGVTKAPNMLLLLAAVLLSGIAIGVGAKLAYDFLVEKKEDVQSQALKPQTGGEKEVPQDTKSLPVNFPPDFPIYEDSTLDASWTSRGELREGISVVWVTEDSPREVSDFYKKRLPEFGWTINSSFETQGSYTISFEKETSDGFIGITTGEGGLTQISVTLGIEMITI